MFSFIFGVLSSILGTIIFVIFSSKFAPTLFRNIRALRRYFVRRISKRRRTIGSSSADKVLKIACVLNSRSAYVVDMEASFLATARLELESIGYFLHVEREIGSTRIQGKENSRALKRLLSSFPNKKPDYIVTFGSGVSSFVHKKKLGIPQIFVGVTDPIRAGLCSSLLPDSARGNICGSKFSVTADDQLSLIQKVFPSARIGFLFNPTVQADLDRLEDWRSVISNSNTPLVELKTEKMPLVGCAVI